MTLDGLFANWRGLAPALGNHLWQSTLFAAAVGLLTLTMQKNRARARYWLWLSASVKFLVPFSLLITIGSQLSLSRGSVGANAVVYRAMNAVSQPFPELVIPETSGATPSAASPPVIPLAVPTLLAVWLCGFLVILSVWLVRWRRISAIARTASPIREGREVEALRRLAAIGGARERIKILLSRASLEPGIFGIARPVLLWSEGLSERLDDAHLEAILAHELWHVQRRDNLAAAVHMLVEAVFWFHPLLWWLGARLVEERERACDEEVLEMGKERQVYAESILKICEFCVESPVTCVSGVTGADLKKRVVRIMAKSVGRKLDFSRKLLLGAAALAAVVVPIAFGLVRPAKNWAESQALGTATAAHMFESAMIRPNNGKSFESWIIWKPDRFIATNVPLHALIAAAYVVGGSEILGGPDWVRSENYDVEAKLDTPVIDELSKLGPDQRSLEQKHILQALLADRFRLALHRERREPPAYVLAIAKDGLKLQEAKPGDTYPDGLKDPQGHPLGAGALLQLGPCKLAGQGVHMADLAKTLSMNYLGGRTVVDQTGLRGVYDFTLDCHTALVERGKSVLTVLPEQVGLELKPLDNLVIDSAEEPSEN